MKVSTYIDNCKTIVLLNLEKKMFEIYIVWSAGGHVYHLNYFWPPTPKDDSCQVCVKSDHVFSMRRCKCKRFTDDGRGRTAMSLRLRWVEKTMIMVVFGSKIGQKGATEVNSICLYLFRLERYTVIHGLSVLEANNRAKSHNFGPKRQWKITKKENKAAPNTDNPSLLFFKESNIQLLSIFNL